MPFAPAGSRMTSHPGGRSSARTSSGSSTAKRAKVKVPFVELADTVQGPETEVVEDMVYGDFVVVLDHPDSQIVSFRRAAVTTLTDVATSWATATTAPSRSVYNASARSQPGSSASSSSTPPPSGPTDRRHPPPNTVDTVAYWVVPTTLRYVSGPDGLRGCPRYRGPVPRPQYPSLEIPAEEEG